MPRRALSLCIVAVALSATSLARPDADLVIDPSAFRLMKSESGPDNYYSVQSDGSMRFLHSRYVPPMKTAVMGYALSDADRSRAKKLRWQWRAVTLPAGGDECASGRADSAAVVYVTWKRGLKYYTLKYVWSAVGRKGSICDSKRNPFVAQDTIVVASGAPLGVWQSVEIDLAHHFRHHFEHDDQSAEVPDLVGIGVMSDGDQTNSESSADFGQFVFTR